MATHSSTLAWRIPGTESLLGCCLWGRTESDTTGALSSSSRSRTTSTLKSALWITLQHNSFLTNDISDIVPYNVSRELKAYSGDIVKVHTEPKFFKEGRKG